MRSSRIASLLAATAAAALLSTSALAERHRTPVNPNPGSWHYNPAPPVHAPNNTKSGTWSALNHAFPGTPDTALLLTDGTVIMHDRVHRQLEKADA